MKLALLLCPLLALSACSQPATPQSGRDAGATAATPATTQAPAAEPVVATPATVAATPNATAGAASRARPDGYGALRLGMSADEARAAWDGELKGDTVEADNCAYLRPAADEEFRIGFMFERGVLVRYDVNIDSETAPGGGRVGQARADIERLYAGRVQVQPHEYVPGGHYLRIADPAVAQGAMVFETDENGRVTRWRVGRAPQVDYVEGCA